MDSDNQTATDIDARKAQSELVRTYFLTHPNVEIGASELVPLVGPNYRSRIADCGLSIENVPKFLEYIGSRKKVCRKRLIGKYIYRDYTPLGRDAGTAVPQRLEIQGPFTPEFELTPPTS